LFQTCYFCTTYVATQSEQLLADKDTAQKHLDAHANTLDDLDELGEIMEEMLTRQQIVEVECEEHLTLLQRHLLTLEDLQLRFLAYQTAFNKLIIEISRRRQYREAAEHIVKGMVSQLEAMTEGIYNIWRIVGAENNLFPEERHVRDAFNADQGAHLPADICLCIENPPTRWEVVPCSGETLEVLPEIENDLLIQVCHSSDLYSCRLTPCYVRRETGLRVQRVLLAQRVYLGFDAIHIKI
jgi:autophagy-related protein 17